MTTELNTEGAAQANPDAVADGKETGAVDTTLGGAEKGGEAAKVEDKPVVPENYDLKLEDGSLLKTEDLDRIKAEAKERGLTNEAAQELVDREGKTIAAYHDTLMKNYEVERDSWVKAAEADKEIGGDSFKENVEVSRRLLKEVASEDFYNKVLAPKADGGLGFGDHPEMIRIFARLAKKGFAEDKAVNGGKGNAGGDSLESRLYPDLK